MRIVVALAVAAVVLTVAGVATARRKPPTLRLLARAPLVVRGLHFHPRERVRITVLGPGRHRLAVRTTAAGTFTARFAGLTADRCTILEIHAVGGRHDHALLGIRPLCPPP